MELPGKVTKTELNNLLVQPVQDLLYGKVHGKNTFEMNAAGNQDSNVSTVAIAACGRLMSSDILKECIKI